MFTNRFEKIYNWIRLSGIIILCYFTFNILTAPSLSMFANTDLVFHEAGHTLTIFFGQFINVFGGTLFQILIPSVFALAFLFKKEFSSATVLFWWLGENLVNISVYIADTRVRILPILGGQEAHDWVYLLGRMGLTNYDTSIAFVVRLIGALIMISAIVILSYITYCKFRIIQKV